MVCGFEPQKRVLAAQRKMLLPGGGHGFENARQLVSAVAQLPWRHSRKLIEVEDHMDFLQKQVRESKGGKIAKNGESL